MEFTTNARYAPVHSEPIRGSPHGTNKNISNNPFREQRSPNPFRGLPSDDSKLTNVANIRELITQLPSEEFDALFDELEEKDFH